MEKWYDRIETGVRDIVYLLRNNGFNTTCSCEHMMDIEGIVSIDGDLQLLHKLLYDYYSERGITPSYDITFELRVDKGYIISHHFYIKLQNDKKEFERK